MLTMAFGLALAQQTGERFDSLVREDFFAGLDGDTARFERAMKKCESVLAAEPKNAAAMVWHGGGVFYQSGAAFRRGDVETGMALHQRGLKEMADAVALEPESVQTRIPRGAILLGSARFMEDQYAKPLLVTAVADYEKALDLQRSGYAQMGVHSKGELLGGLADGYRRLGDTAKSREYLERMVRDLPGSPYEKQAKRWLADPAAVGKQERFCLGCHSGPATR